MTAVPNVPQAEVPAPADAPRRRRRRVLVVVLVAVLVLVGLGVWLGVRAFQAATSLRSAADGVVQIRDRVADGDLTGLDDVASGVQADAARAAEATRDPVWRLAERLPVVGADATAVHVAAQGIDTLASDALVPLVGLGDVLDLGAFELVDGRVDVGPLVTAEPVVQQAAEATAGVRRSVEELEPERLHGPLPGAVADLQEQLAAVDDALSVASRLTSLLPPMLGADGPRSYLLMFLNSAELRAQGGITGAIAVVSAQDGRLELTDQASTEDMPRFDEPVLPLTPGELAVATDVVGRRIQNPVLIPDTPRAGELTAEMWRRATGQVVDGVVAVDPVALSYVIAAVGDVDHPDGTRLSSENLLETLLYTAYADQTTPEDSDAFFAETASVVFRALAAGAGDPAELVRALQRSVGERRLSVWSVRPEEQERIIGTAIDGALLSGGHDDAVGVFLDNTSGWKTDTFLRTAVTLESARCDADTITLEIGLDLTSTLPQDSSGLPYYVVGDGSTGVPIGTMRTRVSIYSPVEGEVTQVRRGEEFVGASGTTMAGRHVQVMTETLGPGASAHYTFTVTAPRPQGDIPLWSTPTTTSPGIAVVPSGCAAG